MISAEQLDALDPQTRQAVQSLLAQVQQRDHEIAFKQALIDKLTHEMAILKRMKFAATSERFASTLSPEQRSLLEETLDTDIHELDGELQRHRKKSDKKDEDEKQSPKRTQLPAHLPRRDVPTSRPTPPAAVARPCSASARTCPRSWTTSRACSPSSAMSVASGSANAASASCRHRCRRT